MKYAIAMLAAVGAGFVVSPVLASSADESLDTIIVTGSRTPIATGDVGSAVTVITRDDIERRQVRYVSDLLRAVPGFAVSRSGVAGSQTQVRVRGAEANHVLVLIDGVRANDPASGDEFRWEYLAAADVERIEVVRGPQSALWGSDAIGGVVHVITRGADAGWGAYLESGSADTLNGALKGNFGDDGWSVGIGIERLATDGSNISRTGDEKDDSDVTTGTLNARLTPSDSLTIRLGARVVDAYTQYDAVDFFVTGLPADSDVAADATQTYAQLGMTAGAADARVRHHLGVHWFDSENLDLVGGLEESSSSSERATLAYQADVTLGVNRLSLALEHETTRFSQRGPVLFEGRATDRLTWLLSARYDDNSDFRDALTGRLSAAWRLADATTLRAGIGTGLKNPTFTERFGFFAQSFVGNPDLEPERSTSYDVGIDRQLGAVGLELSLFRQDLDDEIDGFYCPNPWPQPCTAINTDGKSRRSGAELGLRWNPAERVGVRLSYTYTDSEDAGSAAELRRPRHAGSAQFDYGFASGRGRLTLTADYGGTRFDRFFPPWPNPPEIVTLGQHWLVEVTAQFQVNDSVRLFARGSNLLDTDYEQVYGYRTPGRAAYAGIRVGFGG